MEAEINSLDDKIRQLVHLCQRLRRDNSQLRQQLATAQDENERLKDKITLAADRLASVLEQMPEESE